MLVIVLTAWFFVTDLLSGGGNWSATVTFLVGIVFLAVAASLDAGSRHPYAFWLHVGAGLTIGGSLVYFLHDGDFEWALIAIGGLLYVALASRFGRSSWAVLGAIGILLSAAHYATGDTRRLAGAVRRAGFGLERPARPDRVRGRRLRADAPRRAPRPPPSRRRLAA